MGEHVISFHEGVSEEVCCSVVPVFPLSSIKLPLQQRIGKTPPSLVSPLVGWELDIPFSILNPQHNKILFFITCINLLHYNLNLQLLSSHHYFDHPSKPSIPLKFFPKIIHVAPLVKIIVDFNVINASIFLFFPFRAFHGMPPVSFLSV